MDNKSDEKFLIMQATTEANRQETYEKIMNIIEDLKAMTTSTIISMMDKTNNSKSSPV